MLHQLRQVEAIGARTLCIQSSMNERKSPIDPQRQPARNNRLLSEASAKSASDMSPPTVFGRYRLERELGQGAMGQVFLAEDRQLGRKVAIKIPKRSALDDEALERFYREAR